MTTCKEWIQPDGDHFRGLCQNEFWPKAGTGGCNVCVSPVLSVSTGICTCTALEQSLPRSLSVTIAAGAAPSPAFAFIAPEAYGDWFLSTAFPGIYADSAVYDLSEDTIQQNPNWLPNTTCLLSSLPKIIQIPGTPPAIWSVGIGAQFTGATTSFGHKSWNGVTISIRFLRWKLLTALPGEDRYIIDTSFAGHQWLYAATGPYPRCESTFPATPGAGSYSGGPTTQEYTVDITGGG